MPNMLDMYRLHSDPQKELAEVEGTPPSDSPKRPVSSREALGTGAGALAGGALGLGGAVGAMRAMPPGVHPGLRDLLGTLIFSGGALGGGFLGNHLARPDTQKSAAFILGQQAALNALIQRT